MDDKHEHLSALLSSAQGGCNIDLSYNVECHSKYRMQKKTKYKNTGIRCLKVKLKAVESSILEAKDIPVCRDIPNLPTGDVSHKSNGRLTVLSAGQAASFPAVNKASQLFGR